MNPAEEILSVLTKAEVLQQEANKLSVTAKKMLQSFLKKKLVDTLEASVILGCSTRQLNKLVHDGKLTRYDKDGNEKTNSKNTKTYYNIDQLWNLFKR